jgi:hypothetical protein
VCARVYVYIGEQMSVIRNPFHQEHHKPVHNGHLLIHVNSLFKSYGDVLEQRSMHVPVDITCNAFFKTYFPEAHTFEPTKVNGNAYYQTVHGSCSLSSLARIFPAKQTDVSTPLLTFTEFKIYLA